MRYLNLIFPTFLLLSATICCQLSSGAQQDAVLKDDAYYFEIGRKMSKFHTLQEMLSLEYETLNQAFTELRCEIQNDVTNEKTHFSLARLLQGTGNDSEWVIQQYTLCVALNPSNNAALNNRAVCLYRMRKFRGAYDDIKAALVLAPQNQTVRRNKELIHRELGKQEKFSGKSKPAQKLQTPVEEVLKSEVVEPPENAAALGLLPYSVAVNPKEKQVDQITRNLRLLSVADQFADGVSGLTIPSDAKQEQFLAFRNTATSSSPVPVDKLQNYFNNSTPEGKLYIAALMKKFDNAAGEKRLRSLLRDQTKILYRDGCCIEDVCVAEVAEHLLSAAGLRNLLACENFWSGEECGTCQ